MKRSQFRIGKLVGEDLQYLCTVKPRNNGGVTIADADGLTSEDQTALMKHYGRSVETVVRKNDRVLRRRFLPDHPLHFNAASYGLPLPYRPMANQ